MLYPCGMIGSYRPQPLQRHGHLRAVMRKLLSLPLALSQVQHLQAKEILDVRAQHGF